ncbi:MAG: D-alanyl-D-alanine carboxypeptidase [Methylocystaceae bacterium]|nr:MAG: D-alanyl-D-alanine carboxypeptidase [Methylocystaceae bacterium]
MAKRSVGGWRERSKWAMAHATIILTLLALSSFPAEARRQHHRHGYHHSASIRHGSHHVRFKRHVGHRFHRRAEAGDSPAFAAIVMDANSGRTLYSRSENELRHPASITKVMTLYLLFEQLEKGRLRLDSPLMVSAHAAAQAPSKLGLAPGQTIDVENAIKAVVTKSANDIAVAIAENIGGDEDSFAEMMTRKAHALGMSRTHYANASGLPDDEQITTAHDLAILGRAIQDRFPRYYRYFATHSFSYHGHAHRNHNHLLGQIEGVDGIKTGYTRASGFNLLTSVRRGSRHIVAVVLGGRSGAARDRAMAGLIAENIGDGAPVRTARAIGEGAPAEPIDKAETAQERQEDEAPPVRVSASAPLALAPLAPVVAVPSPDRTDKVRPAFVPGGQKHAEEPIERKTRASAREAVRAVADGSTSRLGGHSQASSAAATTPSAVRKPNAEAAKTLLAKVEAAKVEAAKTDASKGEAARPAHTGWMIQIGATDDADKAHQLLSRARAQGVPATAKPFTEKVQKGKETLWRARFAGLEERSAEAACKTLKRSGFSCFATKN